MLDTVWSKEPLTNVVTVISSPVYADFLCSRMWLGLAATSRWLGIARFPPIIMLATVVLVKIL